MPADTYGCLYIDLWGQSYIISAVYMFRVVLTTLMYDTKVIKRNWKPHISILYINAKVHHHACMQHCYNLPIRDNKYVLSPNRFIIWKCLWTWSIKSKHNNEIYIDFVKTSRMIWNAIQKGFSIDSLTPVEVNVFLKYNLKTHFMADAWWELPPPRIHIHDSW